MKRPAPFCCWIINGLHPLPSLRLAFWLAHPPPSYPVHWVSLGIYFFLYIFRIHSGDVEMIRNQRILHDALIERRLKLAAAAAAAGSVSSVATASSSAVASNASADVLSRSIQRPTSFSYAKGMYILRVLIIILIHLNM